MAGDGSKGRDSLLDRRASLWDDEKCERILLTVTQHAQWTQLDTKMIKIVDLILHTLQYKIAKKKKYPIGLKEVSEHGPAWHVPWPFRMLPIHLLTWGEQIHTACSPLWLPANKDIK